jgi:sigma-B regulation protein RsbU (phosphoserine phosphatase)
MRQKIELTDQAKYNLLRDISYKIRNTLDLDIILNHLLDALKTAMNYDAAGIFILSGDLENSNYHFPGQKIAGIAKRGYKRIEETDEMLVNAKGIIGYVIKTGKSLIVPDVRTDSRYIIGRRQTLSELTVPIYRNDSVIGALDVESDHLSTFDETDLEIVQFFADASAISIEKALLHNQLLEKKKVEEQLRIAKDVQSSLLPAKSPSIKGYDLAGLCIPTYEIGGDYYDFIMLDKNRLAIIIADVSGDGIPAALIMAAFRALLHSQIRFYDEPNKLMGQLNNQLPGFTRKRDFITTFFGILNFSKHSLAYTNCGHNPPILFRSNGQEELLEIGGPSLNIMMDATYETGKININENDQLVLYTDGVVEIFNKDFEEFGVKKLKEIVRRSLTENAAILIDNIVKATEGFSQSHLYQDDYTILVMKREVDR